jgi:hypothetical protein
VSKDGVAKGTVAREPGTSVPETELLARYTALLEGSLTLTKHGSWVHEGVPFSNPKVSDLFHRSVVWDTERKCPVVRLGAQQATFTCEDTPYFVAALRTDTMPWRIVLAGGSEEPLVPESISIGNEEQFYCRAKGTFRARFMRAAHQSLLEYVVDENTLRIGEALVHPRREPGV